MSKTTGVTLSTSPTSNIVIGDSLSHLSTMATSTFDSVVTDPPYGIARDGSMLGQVAPNYSSKGTHTRGYADNDPARYQAWCHSWMLECHRVLKPGGHMVSFGGPPTIHRLITAAEDAGFEVRTQLVWIHRPGGARGHVLTDANGARTGLATTLNPAFEPLVLLRKPIVEKTVKASVAVHGTGALRTAECSIPRLEQDADPRHPATALVEDQAVDLTTWQTPFFVAKPTPTERRLADDVAHPTVKPLALMRYLVRLVTPVDGHVLDPFAGSGTTLEAANLEGLTSTGIELDRHYLRLIEARMRRARPAA